MLKLQAPWRQLYFLGMIVPDGTPETGDLNLTKPLLPVMEQLSPSPAADTCPSALHEAGLQRGSLALGAPSPEPALSRGVLAPSEVQQASAAPRCLL